MTRHLDSPSTALMVGLLLVVTASCRPSQPQDPGTLNAADVTIACHGGAGQVSGSLFEIRIGQQSVLLDCGTFYPEGAGSLAERTARAETENSMLDVQSSRIAGVVLTHAHLDHVGRLPLLVERGSTAPIHATRTTRALLEPMLEMLLGFSIPGVRDFAWSTSSSGAGTDGAKAESVETPPTTVHSQACRWAGKIHPRNRKSKATTLTELRREVGSISVCRSCRTIEAERVLKFVQVHDYGEDFLLARGVQGRLLDAGHIPGSSSVLLEIMTAEGPRRMVFSGDIGNRWSTLVQGPKPCPKADVVFVEATYSSSVRNSALDEQRAFRKQLGDALQRGQIVWVPAFALDRTQKILHQVRMGQHEGRVPTNVTILVPSPTTTRISKVYRSVALAERALRPELSDVSFLDDGLTDWRECDAALERRLRNAPSEPLLLITTSGMMDAAFSADQLERLLPRQDVTVMLVGYADPGSEAGQLAKGQTFVDTQTGKHIDVRAEISSFGSFSAHADEGEANAWLEAVPAAARLYVVHGELDSMLARAARLRDAGRQFVEVPRRGETLRPFAQ